MASADWWTDYFDAQYLLEYEPLFSPSATARKSHVSIDVLGAAVGRAHSRRPVRTGAPRPLAR